MFFLVSVSFNTNHLIHVSFNTCYLIPVFFNTYLLVTVFFNINHLIYYEIKLKNQESNTFYKNYWLIFLIQLTK